jgi:hypothetical protein
MRNSVTIDYSRALTGISTIDNATKTLSETLGKTLDSVDYIPEWAPAVYGTAVHVDFAAQVRGQGIPGISPGDVEQSFFNKDTADYGDPGSIRTDVILRNDIGDIIAIYDVKTGGAVLSAARVRELRDHTGVGPEVPIIELQVNRGAVIKGRIGQRKKIGTVIALLWNPVHQGSVGRAAGV